MQQNSQGFKARPDKPLFDNPASWYAAQLLDGLFAWYAEMRHESPVFYDSGRKSWTVFRYQDVKRVFSDWQIFSSCIPHPPAQTDFTQSLNFTDPSKPLSLRSLAQQVFNPHRVEQLIPRMTAITHELHDRVATQGQMDFMHDLAIPVPLIVIAEILGIPLEDRDDFKRWSDGIVTLDPISLQSMADYFRDLNSAASRQTK